MRPLASPPTAERFQFLASVRQNFAWSLLGNLTYAASQWGILVVLAKLGSVEMVGQYGFAIAVTGPVFLLANMSLGVVLATDVRGENDFANYSGARLVTTLTSVLAICGLALFSRWAPAITAVVLAVAASKALESFSDILYGLFQQREAMDRIGRSMLFRGLLSLCAALVAVRFATSALAASLAVAAAWAMVFLQFDIPNGAALLGSRHALVPRLQAGSILRMLRAALPLGIVAMLISLTANIPRYFLEHGRGTKDLGIFVGLAYISTAASLVVGSLGTAVTVRLSTLHSHGELSSFKKLVGRLLLCGAGLGVAEIAVAVGAGRPVLRLLYTPEYAEHEAAFVVAMIAAGITHVASFFGYATTAARRFVVQVPLWLLIMGAAAVFSAFAIPAWGILGASWALVVAAAVQLASYAWVYARLVARDPASERPRSIELGQG
jgi:O-antigen/teichoic acid export membrane protein